MYRFVCCSKPIDAITVIWLLLLQLLEFFLIFGSSDSRHDWRVVIQSQRRFQQGRVFLQESNEWKCIIGCCGRSEDLNLDRQAGCIVTCRGEVNSHRTESVVIVCGNSKGQEER